MPRRKWPAFVAAVGFFVVGTATAQAGGGWDLIGDQSGHDRVTMRAWTRSYNQVAFVADHPGTRVRVTVVVDCRNGDHFDDRWSEGGSRFRFVVRGLGESRRCEHTFRVDAAEGSPLLELSIRARV